MHPRVVLFDLDGTLTQSAPGITRSVEHALRSVGHPPLDGAALHDFIGPPLRDSFREIAGLDELETERAVAAYVSYFTDRGIYENSVYPGIVDLLQALTDAGRRLAVATSKPEPVAERILRHFGLTDYFEVICGADSEELRADKFAVVVGAMKGLQVEASADVVLIGDRSHDVHGAHRAGVWCIGAAWGYGAPGELADAGADAIAADIGEAAALLGVPQEARGSAASQKPTGNSRQP